MADINPGANLNKVPAPNMQTLATAYIDFTSADEKGWAQQYLPDLMEKEAEVFGNRTVSGFLAQVGAEEAMSADQVVWSEQGRLHLSYLADHDNSADGTFTVVGTVDNATAGADNGIRIGDMVIISDSNSTVKCYVTDSCNDSGSSLGAGVFKVLPYTTDTMVNAGIALSATDVSVFVFGSEYKKGQPGRDGAIKPQFKSFTNKPIILKDKYEISGSDASQIGWVEVSGEDGQNGYYWYLKAAGDTRARFTDYCEMTLVEAEKTHADSTVAVEGTEGLFAAITDRGNITTEVGAMGDFDNILKEFDKQGSIEEYMMFLNRSQSLEIDDMLADQNSYGAGGSSYGVFDNDENMALNLGFSGFRRGSYDFYKTDWKYLNDKGTRGGLIDAATGDATNGLGAVKGVFVPAGVSSVYDQNLGRNLKRPFLHVRYRASQTDNRRMKTWTTGSVGAITSDLDAMEMHFLSERCLVVQGANNFMLVKG